MSDSTGEGESQENILSQMKSQTEDLQPEKNDSEPRRTQRGNISEDSNVVTKLGMKASDAGARFGDDD